VPLSLPGFFPKHGRSIATRVWACFYCLSLLLTDSLHGQYQYFASPVRHKYTLSGNFCELRNSHFHAGIDIRASRPGAADSIFSIATGHVSRVKISSGGYGKAVWVEHPEVGYTSVYAHLDKFNTPLSQWVDSLQQETESYETDFYLEPHQFPVSKAAWLGIMGNTGFSFGPHLHFEIRDTKTDDFINPFLVGFDVTDNLSPHIHAVAIHSLDSAGHVVQKTEWRLEDSNQTVSEKKKAFPIPTKQAGIAIQTTDHADGSQNTLGLYRLHVFMDDSLCFSCHFDKMPQTTYRQLNGFVDYQTKRDEGRTFSLCYSHPGSFFPFCFGKGVIPLYNPGERNIRVEAEDFCHNKKTILLSLAHSPETRQEGARDTTKTTCVKHTEKTTITLDNALVTFSDASLYRNIDFSSSVARIQGSMENKYRIHDPAEALKSPYRLAIIPQNMPKDKHEKATIAMDAGGGLRFFFGSHWQEDSLVADIDEFGTFFIDYDTLGPKILPVYFQNTMTKSRPLAFSIADLFIARGKNARSVNYKVWVDDCFVPAPLSMKNVVEIPVNRLSLGWHILRLEATDHAGNASFFSAPFQLVSDEKWKNLKKKKTQKKKRKPKAP
jgi:hypothetical protein